MSILKNLLTVLFLAVPIAGFGQDMRTETVHFAPGASGVTIQGRITGYESVAYRIGAEAGQRMVISFAPSNLATYFNVLGPGKQPGDEALANSGMTGPNVPDLNRFDATLPASGEYTILVYMMRSAARRNEVSNYSLDVSIGGKTGAVVQGDYADGLAGGPDYYRVRTSGGALNLRAGPSAGAGLVMQLLNGTELRNLGCRMAEGRRWCRVATLADPGYEGWAVGDFLVEGTGQVSTASSQGTGVAGGSSRQRVQFAAGTSGAEISGALAPGESRSYVIGAANGQFLYVRVADVGQGLSYQIFNPDGSFLLDQMTAAQEYRGQLWQGGDHVVEVINRTGANASYQLIIGID